MKFSVNVQYNSKEYDQKEMDQFARQIENKLLPADRLVGTLISYRGIGFVISGVFIDLDNDIKQIIVKQAGSRRLIRAN